ncbi:outer membrane insertion C-terminal signal [Salegentibacter echinorum]|uniref:Outer membrane insertion C-terminal signal n=1 Tax=Salegentibacter echinorum TaxID=1073325 RepID=A0A1M5HCP8_SALEC|nr:DUF2490 domain-containing protein [Salegentibacter echinorum]SHG13658.1 outer membrane insertion C-terminal signal [Salegentibacter echinorum]
MKHLFSKNHLLIFLIAILFFNQDLKAQDNVELLIEPEFSIDLDTKTQWTHSFGIASRDIIFEEKQFHFNAQHIELSHFTGYKLDDANKVSLGVRYRFKEIFHDAKTDELRIVEQFSHGIKKENLKIGHRLRIEQRITDITRNRTRYRFSLEFPLNNAIEPRKVFSLKTSAEALWMIGKKIPTTYEQRLSISVGKEIGVKTDLDFGIQYRLSDYTHHPEHRFFLTTGLNVTI